MKLRKFFTSKTIVYTHRWKPGVLIKRFYFKGEKWLRIGFPNLQKYPGTLPITDVRQAEVTAIRKAPSPFTRWLFRLAGKKAKGKYYVINQTN